MVYEPKSPPSKIARFSESGADGSEAGIDLGLELGLGTNFDAEMRKYKEKKGVDDDDDDRNKKKKRMTEEEDVSMGFTFMQRTEFEQQACIFKYIQSGLQVPYPLLYPLWKSVERSIDCAQFSAIPNLFGGSVGRSWMGSSDPEPGRCKRTDGKKWRCAKEALPDSKYCEKHLHRGRHRSRKLVETSSAASSASADAGGGILSSHPNAHFPASEMLGLSVAQPCDD